MVIIKDDLGEILKRERMRRRYPLEEMNKNDPENPLNRLSLIPMKSFDSIDKKLREMDGRRLRNDNNHC